MIRLVIGYAALQAIANGWLALLGEIRHRLQPAVAQEPFQCAYSGAGLEAQPTVARGDLIRHNAGRVTAEVILADAAGVLVSFADGSTANFKVQEIADHWKPIWRVVPKEPTAARALPPGGAEIIPFRRPAVPAAPFRPHGAA